MPAYNAAKTLERTYADIPQDLVDHVILVDDVSHDETVEIARQLGLEVIVHARTAATAATRRPATTAALAAGADVVVMLHPDYQYDATRIPQLVAPILAGEADLVLGSRDPRRPARGRHAQVEVRLQPVPDRRREPAFGLRLSEYHTGLRAYSRRLLETIPYQPQLATTSCSTRSSSPRSWRVGGLRIGEIAVPTRYFEEASSVGFRRSVVYGLSTLRVVAALPAPPDRAPPVGEAACPRPPSREPGTA